MARAQHLFFDLDGTLTDSAEGIVACVQHALARLARPQPSADEIRPFIGSHSLRAIFEAFLSDSSNAEAGLAERAIDFYRERFDSVGFAENQVYPGIQTGLDRLRSEGHALYIVTAKRPEDALRVVRHFSLDGLFGKGGVGSEGVFGAQTDAERSAKAIVLARALKNTGAPAEQSVMIGDRSHDMLAAVRTGATPLGAGWGYGSPEELRESGALQIASSPGEMVEWIGKQTLAPGRSTATR